MFYKECETHQSDQVEMMCFCSYFLCNGSSSNLIKTAPNNVFTLVWFIILVTVLNKTLNSLDYTQYHHASQNIWNGRKKSANNRLVNSKEISKVFISSHQNQNLLKENVRLSFDRWKYGCLQQISSRDMIIKLKQFKNTDTELNQKRITSTLFYVNISGNSEVLLDSALVNEDRQLIKQPQNGCHPLSHNDYSCSPLAKLRSTNEEIFVMLPFEKIDTEFLQVLMQTNFPSEPVTT